MEDIVGIKVRPQNGNRVGGLRQKERRQRGKKKALSFQPLVVDEISFRSSDIRYTLWKDEEWSAV